MSRAPRSSPATGRCTRRSPRPRSSSRRCCRRSPPPTASTSRSARRSSRCRRWSTPRAARACEIFAQTMHEADEGAFTGEVSPRMLAEIDVDGVVLGHSERRELFGETDRALALKVPAALEAGLTPILCVGETEEERERGDTERKLRHQVQEGLEKVPVERLPEVVVAYEPIWAIGSGRSATPEQAQEAVAFVRALVEGIDKAGRPGGADPLRRLAQARERRGAAGAARRRRRARRRRLARPGLVRADRRDRAARRSPLREHRPRRLPRHPRRLGAGAGRTGERDLARRHAGVRRAVGDATTTRS